MANKGHLSSHWFCPTSVLSDHETACSDPSAATWSVPWSPWSPSGSPRSICNERTGVNMRWDSVGGWLALFFQAFSFRSFTGKSCVLGINHPHPLKWSKYNVDFIRDTKQWRLRSFILSIGVAPLYSPRNILSIRGVSWKYLWNMIQLQQISNRGNIKEGGFFHSLKWSSPGHNELTNISSMSTSLSKTTQTHS